MYLLSCMTWLPWKQNHLISSFRVPCKLTVLCIYFPYLATVSNLDFLAFIFNWTCFSAVEIFLNILLKSRSLSASSVMSSANLLLCICFQFTFTPFVFAIHFLMAFPIKYWIARATQCHLVSLPSLINARFLTYFI